MVEIENHCTKAGCQAACCRDVFFVIEESEKKIKRIFPDAIKKSFDSFPNDNFPQGVYYRKFFWGGCDLRLVGICPHLSGSACGIWEEERLSDCQKMSRGSDDCVDLRRLAERLNALSQPPQP